MLHLPAIPNTINDVELFCQSGQKERALLPICRELVLGYVGVILPDSPIWNLQISGFGTLVDYVEYRILLPADLLETTDSLSYLGRYQWA